MLQLVISLRLEATQYARDINMELLVVVHLHLVILDSLVEESGGT